MATTPTATQPEATAAATNHRLLRIQRAGHVAWAVLGIAGLLFLVGFVCWVFRVVFPPLILAAAIVFILNPVVTRLQRRRIPRALGAAISYLGVIGAVFLIGLLIAPLASRQADDLSERWTTEIQPNLEEDINDLARRSQEGDWFIQIPEYEELGESFSGGGETTFAERITQIRELGLRVFHVLIIFVLGPIIAFYLLVDLPHIRRVAEGLIPERSRAEVMVVAGRLNRAIGGFFRGQLVVAFIVGVMVSIGLAILGLPFWLLIGMIAGIFNMIPLIGPYIGGIPGVIIALTAGDGMSQALWVVAIMTAAQQIDNHFITPNVMQRVVKLHPAAVMLALLAGGTLGGLFGILLAVPVAAILKILLGHVWRTYVLGEPIEQLAAIAASDATQEGVGFVQEVGPDDEPPVAADPPATERPEPS
ncbi:MAG: AI-2E family transporter [Actinomycetota bacterium]|nr:AI-2E family transporter [Actinomycetota bacterium]